MSKSIAYVARKITSVLQLLQQNRLLTLSRELVFHRNTLENTERFFLRTFLRRTEIVSR